MHSPAPNEHEFYFLNGLSVTYTLPKLEFEEIFVIQNASIFAQVELASSLGPAPQTGETESPAPQMQNGKKTWQISFLNSASVLACSFRMNLLDGQRKYWSGYDRQCPSMPIRQKNEGCSYNHSTRSENKLKSVVNKLASRLSNHRTSALWQWSIQGSSPLQGPHLETMHRVLAPEFFLSSTILFPWSIVRREIGLLGWTQVHRKPVRKRRGGVGFNLLQIQKLYNLVTRRVPAKEKQYSKYWKIVLEGAKWNSAQGQPWIPASCPAFTPTFPCHRDACSFMVRILRLPFAQPANIKGWCVGTTSATRSILSFTFCFIEAFSNKPIPILNRCKQYLPPIISTYQFYQFQPPSQSVFQAFPFCIYAPASSPGLPWSWFLHPRANPPESCLDIRLFPQPVLPHR